MMYDVSDKYGSAYITTWILIAMVHAFTSPWFHRHGSEAEATPSPSFVEESAL